MPQYHRIRERLKIIRNSSEYPMVDKLLQKVAYFFYEQSLSTPKKQPASKNSITDWRKAQAYLNHWLAANTNGNPLQTLDRLTTPMINFYQRNPNACQDRTPEDAALEDLARNVIDSHQTTNFSFVRKPKPLVLRRTSSAA